LSYLLGDLLKVGKCGVTMFNFGILQEESDYRVHICFVEGYAYLFKTSAGRDACNSGIFKMRQAFQPGVDGATANGYIVPPMKIEGCKRIQIPTNILQQVNCVEFDKTTAKGNKAVECVRQMFKLGLLPISIETKFIEDKDIQIKGIDIIVIAHTKIEVKCDYKGGVQGTGNLYLQIAERNPLKHH
jgi:hypothetical protein